MEMLQRCPNPKCLLFQFIFFLLPPPVEELDSFCVSEVILSSFIALNNAEVFQKKETSLPSFIFGWDLIGCKNSKMIGYEIIV
jgi:hypothetical protein